MSRWGYRPTDVDTVAPLVTLVAVDGGSPGESSDNSRMR